MLDNQDKKFEISKAQPANIKPQDTIDLLELFYVLKKKILLILMAALIGGCVAGAYTQFFMTPVYSSMSSILVLSKETTLTSLADLQLGASLTSDYTVLIKSTPVLEQVIENLNLDTTVEELKNQISINNPTDTRILEITVQDTDATMAKKVVDEIANVSSDYIGDKMEVVPPKVIEVGKIATVRTSPSVKKNIMLGFLLGFVACAGIIVVYAVRTISGVVCWGDDLLNGAESDTYSYMAVLQKLLTDNGYNLTVVNKTLQGGGTLSMMKMAGVSDLLERTVIWRFPMCMEIPGLAVTVCSLT